MLANDPCVVPAISRSACVRTTAFSSDSSRLHATCSYTWYPPSRPVKTFRQSGECPFSSPVSRTVSSIRSSCVDCSGTQVIQADVT